MSIDQTLENLRAKQAEHERLAVECREAADDLEAAIANAASLLEGGLVPSQGTENQTRAAVVINDQAVNLRSDVTVAELIEAVRVYGGRTNHLAQRLNTSEDEIARLVKESDGQVYKANRGWHKLKDETQREAATTNLDGF